MAGGLNDQLLAKFLTRTPFYADGWGDEAMIEAVIALLAEEHEPEPIDITWTTHGRIAEGYFRSPADRHIPLPPESRTAYIRFELPAPQPGAQPPPVCVYLAGTGDQGYLGRRIVSAPLVDRGIGAIILENPYYGRRKPRAQKYIAPQRFIDQLMMNYATIEEGRALLRWLKDAGYEHVGVAGFSMGGFMAAYVAAATPFPIAVAPCAAGSSAGPTFTESPLSQALAWEKLQDGLQVDARERFLELVNNYALTNWSPPSDPQSAVIVGMQDDLIIPRDQVQLLHEHWQGSRLRWVSGAHMSGIVGRVRAVREAIYDAFSIRIYNASQDT